MTVSPLPEQIPFDYLDKVCMAASSRERGISSAPVWQLQIDGDFDEGLARKAIGALARRYPILASRAVSAESGKTLHKARRIAYQPDSTPDLDKLFKAIDISGADSAEFGVVQQREFNHFIDMENEYPARFIWVRKSGTGGVLMMQQHHGIADGRAFFELIQALCGFYDQAENGSLPAVIVPVPKLPEMDVAEPNRWRRFRYGLAGALMHTWNIIRYTLRPPDQLVCNQPGDFRGNNRVHHHYVDSDLLQSIRAVGKQSGFSTNDLLTGALAVSLAQWSDEYGFPVNFFNVLIPIDMRPRPWTLQSFANHLSSFLVDVNLRRMPTVMDIVAAIRRQVQRQATRLAPRKKVISEIAVARTTTLEQVHKAVYRPQRTMLNFPFSNLIPISPAQHGGRYVTRNWQGEGLRVMTPCAWLQAVNTTVIRYAGQLCFNFNYKESIVSQEMVKRLTELYQASLVKVVEDAVAGGRV